MGQPEPSLVSHENESIRTVPRDSYGSGSQYFLVDLGAIVGKELDAEHVAVVGDRHASHAVGHGLIDKSLDRRLSIEQGIISMYVEMNEILHNRFFEVQRYGEIPTWPKDYYKNLWS